MAFSFTIVALYTTTGYLPASHMRQCCGSGPFFDRIRIRFSHLTKFFSINSKNLLFRFPLKKKILLSYSLKFLQGRIRTKQVRIRPDPDPIRIRNTDTKNQIYSCIPVCFLLMCQKSCSKLCTVRSFCWQLLANSLFCNIHTHTHTHWYYIQITMAVDSNIIIVIRI